MTPFKRRSATAKGRKASDRLNVETALRFWNWSSARRREKIRVADRHVAGNEIPESGQPTRSWDKKSKKGFKRRDNEGEPVLVGRTYCWRGARPTEGDEGCDELG